MPEHVDAAASFVRPEDVAAQVRVSADVERHVAWLREDAELGFSSDEASAATAADAGRRRRSVARRSAAHGAFCRRREAWRRATDRDFTRSR
ncbi:hypothetical protein WMF11_36495 [Sorangium sp. So ce295]|uniref:hypothetical protein n=1 Tax=Sorangium sp. So ce295 TaxID=3133295 RepID=UPI003F6169BB